MQIDPPIISRLLEGWPVGRLATVTPAGDPHALPVVFVEDDGRICIPVDGKRKRQGRGAGTRPARIKNVEAHGRACLLLDRYAADWSQLWWVKLTGRAWVARGEEAERLAPTLRNKYPQYDSMAPFSGEPTMLMLHWDRVACWSQTGDLSAILDSLP